MAKLKWGWVLIFILVFTGCNKEEIGSNPIEGIYLGSITEENTTHSTSPAASDAFVGEITSVGNQLEFHCYADNLEIEMRLDHFEHHDSIMVCLTGDDYASLYGHRHGEGMPSQMGMNHRNSGGTAWTRHLNNWHAQDETHFLSGFNTNNGTFRCTFDWNEKTVTFRGIKKQE